MRSSRTHNKGRYRGSTQSTVRLVGGDREAPHPTGKDDIGDRSTNSGTGRRTQEPQSGTCTIDESSRRHAGRTQPRS